MAPTIERIGSGCACNLMRVLIRLTAPLERLYSVSSDAGDFKARFGTRWFDFFQSADMLAEVGVDGDAFVIGA